MAISSHTVDMLPGQAMPLWGASGLLVHVMTGAIILTEPLQWLAGTVTRDRQRLVAGDAYVLRCSGWFTVEAEAAASLLVRADTSRSQGGASLLLAFQSWITRAMDTSTFAGPRENPGTKQDVRTS